MHRIPVHLIRAIELSGHIQSIAQIDHTSPTTNKHPHIVRDESTLEFSGDIPSRITPGKLQC